MRRKRLFNEFFGPLTYGDGFWFVILSIWHGINPFNWPRNWTMMQAAKLADIRKAIWEAKKQGKIREDKNGYLWPK